MIICMDKTNRIMQLTKNKDFRTTLMFNGDLWELFKKACEMDNMKATPKLETLMINFIDEKGLL